MPEQFALNQFGRNSGAVACDERHIRAVALLEQHSCHDFLACTVLTSDEHARLGWCNFGDHFANVLYCFACTDHLVLAVDFLFEGCGFVAQRGCFMTQLLAVNAVSCGNEQSVEVERFLQEVVGALFDTLHGCFNVAVTGNHDHRNIGTVAVRLLERRK